MDFNNIEDIYLFVETNLPNTRIQDEFTRTLKQLVDRTTNDVVKEKIKWEMFAFDFMLEDGKANPPYSTVKEDGTTIWEYPSYNDFTDKAYEYLKQRLESVKSDFLRVRYAQILWNSPTNHKHQQQAKIAVDAYLRILNDINCYKKKPSERRNCLEIFKNGFALSMALKYKADEFKKLARSWLFTKGKLLPNSKICLLNYMLGITQFKKADFEGSLELLQKLSKLKKQSDHYERKNIFETGLKIAQKISADAKLWNKRIADNLVLRAESRMDDTSKMVPLAMYKEAIPYYKAAGLEKKVKEVEHIYSELKKELKLSTIEIPFDESTIEFLQKHEKEKSAKILQQTPDQILGYLLIGKDLFPSQKSLVEMENNKEKTFLDFVTTMKFDINNNVSKAKGDKESKKKANIYENYNLYMQMYVIPLLHRIFIDGMKAGKLTYETSVKFILEKTWLGQTLSKPDMAGNSIEYKWISVIAPSIHEYFVQTESALRSSNPYTSYVMPIDSLTLKFEGALRDFASLLGVSTTITGKRDVLREKYIEELLAEDKIKEYFDENDLLFFNYLFVAKDGMNLRNNIAHSFYRFNNYSFHIMHLLICAFLRLGKYRININ